MKTEDESRALAVALCSAILAADAKLLAEHPQLFADDPSCPACGHKHCAHWNGGIAGVSWKEFRGTSLSANDGEDGDREEIKCPNCGTTYVVTQHVERIVKRTASLPNTEVTNARDKKPTTPRA